ncbi:MAG: nucleoside 2-deoxyribosyltransferase [Oscillospiraceae bacterium]|nr:nucleoside 2-deoxyribosyltransferase [Oscillospiraceae bacterium]
MEKEKLYIAGPMCFYRDGYPRWYVMRDRARVKGFEVTMPGDGELDLDPHDLRQNGDAIFANCARCMNESTAILCNLEFYRGADVDGGSIYEVGMAYAKGAHCYGYTRDKRPMVWKYQGSILRDGVAYDRKGRPLPYGDLPFSPNVVGAMKIVEGDFDDCLQVFALDREEQRKRSAVQAPAADRSAAEAPRADGRPVIYIAGPERYDANAQEQYADMKALCSRFGLRAIVPTDEIRALPEDLAGDAYIRAYHIFDRQQQHVRDCDILIANLNDFHGWEPDSDTAFECGMAFQLGKKLYGYMDSTARMIDRVPNLGPENEYRDICGCNAENFDYPINIMFASSMTIVQGGFGDALARAVQDMEKAGSAGAEK